MGYFFEIFFYVKICNLVKCDLETFHIKSASYRKFNVNVIFIFIIVL